MDRRRFLAASAAAAATGAHPATARAQAAAAPRRILFVVSNPARSTANGMALGYWLGELAHPFAAFQRLGWSMQIASPAGGAVVHDAASDPDGRFGDPNDLVNIGFKHSARVQAMLAETRPLAAVRPDDHDAIFVVGGLAPNVTFADHVPLHRLFAAFFEAGKVAAAICHGTCILLKTRLSDGRLLVDGRRWTGYTNAEEDVVDKAFGVRLQPFRIEDEARKLSNTTFVSGPAFRPFAITDGRLVTGQQSSSGALTADHVIRALQA